MAQHVGIVIKTEPGNYAQVLADRKAACGGCQSTSDGCLSCLTSAKIESRVANPVNAHAGDLVKIRLSSTNLLTGAAILYLLPIIGMLIGAFAGVLVSTAFGLTQIIGSIGGAITGLIVGYAAVITLDRSPSIRRRMMPTITTILAHNVGIPYIKNASCCG
jgi:sigma-E factor negative regulatory protein RseC